VILKVFSLANVPSIPLIAYFQDIFRGYTSRHPYSLCELEEPEAKRHLSGSSANIPARLITPTNSWAHSWTHSQRSPILCELRSLSGASSLTHVHM
jgi:hypothetical protein